MLYDPKWEVQTKPDVLSLESLIAWLERQPADKTYCATASGICLIAQWVESIDLDWKAGPGHSFMYIVHGVNTDFRRFEDIVFGDDKTFGAALTRARVAQAAQ